MVFSNNLLAAAASQTGGGGDYAVGNSAMFNSANTESFTDAPGAGDRRTWTLSFWTKLTGQTVRSMLFGQGSSYLSFNEVAEPDYRFNLNNNGWVWTTDSTFLFRDPTAWYHIVWAMDSTNATADHRNRFYINGIEITSFTKYSTGSLNAQGDIGNTGTVTIGKHPSTGGNPFDGYMAEMVYIDGTQHAPTSFGEFDSYGVWKPIDVSGLTFGTKGWYLPFSNSPPFGTFGESNNGTLSINSINPNSIGYTFTAPSTTTLTTIQFEGVSGTTGNVDAYIYTNNSGSPGSVAKSLGTFATANSVFSITADFSMTAGTVYWIVLIPNGTIDQQLRTVSVSTANPIASGRTDNGGAATTITVGKNTSLNWRVNLLTSAAGLGTDASGNGFNFTNNNTVSQSGDSPTKNFATISPIDKKSGIALAAGNLSYTAASTWTAAGITQAPTQKTYWEFRPTSNDLQVGVNNVPSAAKAGTSTYYTGSGVVLWQHNSYWNGGSNSGGKTAWSSGDVCAVAFDPATGKIWFAVNNTWNDSGNPATGSNASVTLAEGVSPGYEFIAAGESGSMVLNFGQDDTFGGTETSQGNSDGNGNGAFHYAPPSGFLALAATSMAEPSVPDGTAQHQAILYSGNSATQVVSQAGNSGFTPDWAIIKSRSFANGANSFDAVRGSTKGVATFDDGAEDTNANGVAFSLNGNVLRYEDTTLTASNGSGFGAAIDTNPATQWSEGTAATAAGATFTITFTGNARHIRRLKIQTASGNNVATGQKLQYSLNGTDFVDAGSYTVVADNSFQAFNFDASASANIWRLITTTALANPYSWAINQLEMYENQDGVTGGKGNLGFTGAGDTGDINNSGRTYVGLTWNAGGSTASNSNGSITSSVRASSTSGISIGTYTGTGSAATVGHGLGLVPRMIWVKKRSGTHNWACYSAPAGNAFYQRLDTEAARAEDNGFWSSTTPTTTVFNVNDVGAVNEGSGTFVFYAMADVAGYQKIGAYIGNGNNDGPVISTGFKPQYVMIKSTTQASTNWEFFCDEIEPYNSVGNQNFYNITNAEASNDHEMDWLANGFKLRDTSGSVNTSGATFLYWAIAKYPFGGNCPAPSR